MNKRPLIGNILAEDGEAEEEQLRFILNKRRVLLNKDELSKVHRRRRSDPEIMTTAWLDEEHDLFENSPFIQTVPQEILPVEIETKICTCEYSGKIAEMAKEQNGSRLLQQKLDTYTADQKQAVFEEASQTFKTLVNDIFGNFVLQKIIEVGTKEHRKTMAGLFTGRVVEYSMQMYACRVLQKLLECVEYDQKRAIVLEFKNNLEGCLENEYANHVIQKCIEKLPYNCVDFIVDCIKARAIYWIDHSFGCRVVQRIIESVPKEHWETIFATTIMNSIQLSKTNFGNYVVQHILEKGTEQDKNELIKSFYGKICELSKNKIAR